MNHWVIAVAIVLGAVIVAGAILVRPSGFGECMTIVSADILHRNLTATLDPRDVEAEAARVCSGVAR